MKKIIFIASLLVANVTFNANAMTQEECKPQAMQASTMLEIVEGGLVPDNNNRIEHLKKAVSLVKKGDYCAARTILINLGMQ